MPHEDAGRGFIGKNDYKEKENQPDYTGRLTINGEEYRLSGWSREKEGRRYLSIAVSVAQPRVGGQDFKKNAPQTQQAPVKEELTDDLPF